jgi:uracil-DNA glycosylase
MKIPKSWQSVLEAETKADYFARLKLYLREERKQHQVFPAEGDVFAALKLTSYDEARVLLLGQDPYHDDHQAHGLCFSVQPGIKPPPSLQNIYRELRADIGGEPPEHGDLTAWAEQGVLMLNTVLTVRAHEPHSHKNRGWERFTDAIIRVMNDKTSPVVFVLWGRSAQRKRDLVNQDKHAIVEGAHPSPLSARRGFLGSRPFSKINAALREAGHPEINWLTSQTESRNHELP